MAWESFFLTVGGAKPHHDTCQNRRYWNALSEGECSICMQQFVPKAEPPVLVAGCLHRFHASCINEWMARKPTCPVCRGPARPEQIQTVVVTDLGQKLGLTLSSQLTEICGAPSSQQLHTSARPSSLSGGPWKRWLLSALGAYARQPFTSSILRLVAVQTSVS